MFSVLKWWVQAARFSNDVDIGLRCGCAFSVSFLLKFKFAWFLVGLVWFRLCARCSALVWTNERTRAQFVAHHILFIGNSLFCHKECFSVRSLNDLCIWNKNLKGFLTEISIQYEIHRLPIRIEGSGTVEFSPEHKTQKKRTFIQPMWIIK